MVQAYSNGPFVTASYKTPFIIIGVENGAAKDTSSILSERKLRALQHDAHLVDTKQENVRLFLQKATHDGWQFVHYLTPAIKMSDPPDTKKQRVDIVQPSDPTSNPRTQADADMPDALTSAAPPSSAPTGLATPHSPSQSSQSVAPHAPAAAADQSPLAPAGLKITANGFLTFPEPFELSTVNGKAILVGPNGAGKTNVLRVLRLCVDALHKKGFYPLTHVLENATATVELSSLPPAASKVLSTLFCLSTLCEISRTWPEDRAALVKTGALFDEAVDQLRVSGFRIQVNPDALNGWLTCSFSSTGEMFGKQLQMEFGSAGRGDKVHFRLGADEVSPTDLWAKLTHQGMPSPGEPQGTDVRYALRSLRTYSKAIKELGGITNWETIHSQRPWEVFMEVVRVYVPTLFACYPADPLRVVPETTEQPNMVSLSRVESALAKVGTRTRDPSSRLLWSETITSLWKSLMDGKELFAEFDVRAQQYCLQIEAPGLGLPRYGFSEASSGEQNVLTVLALLFAMPEVLVVALDEPLSNLYRPLQKEAEWLLNKSNKCVLMTTHATGILGPRTLPSVYHLSFPGSGQRPVSAEHARQQIARLYPGKASKNHREHQSHRHVLDPTMRELFFVNGAILVEGPNDERFLAALEAAQIELQEGVKTEKKTPLSHWTVRHCGSKDHIPHAATLLAVLGIPFLVLMDDDGDGFAGALASRVNAIQGMSPRHWWGYFQFPGELEDSIVGSDPQHTAGYLNFAPFQAKLANWRKTTTEDARQRLAGTGDYKGKKGCMIAGRRCPLVTLWTTVWYCCGTARMEMPADATVPTSSGS